MFRYNYGDFFGLSLKLLSSLILIFQVQHPVLPTAQGLLSHELGLFHCPAIMLNWSLASFAAVNCYCCAGLAHPALLFGSTTPTWTTSFPTFLSTGALTSAARW